MGGDAAVRVSRLARHPVKACGAEPLEVAELGPAGIHHDRELAVVVGDEIVTQREHPRLARVRPSLADADADATGDLSLRLAGVEGLGEVTAVVAAAGRTRTVTIFGQPVEVVEQAPELSAWFASVLGADACLVMAPDSSRRRSTGAREGLTVLSDGGTVSLHSEASLDELNRRLAERGCPPLPADRFRVNVVLAGCAAHAEDGTDRFELDEVVLGFARVDTRCAVTTVDQQRGRRAGPEPLRTLADYRRGTQGGVGFGVYLTVERPGLVRVGDPVVLHES